jgi:hypothetical protein
MRAELSELGARVSQLEGRMTALESAVVAIGLRLDRMFLALVGGLVVIAAAMTGPAFTPWPALCPPHNVCQRHVAAH